jgi:hypothetical protein
VGREVSGFHGCIVQDKRALIRVLEGYPEARHEMSSKVGLGNLILLRQSSWLLRSAPGKSFSIRVPLLGTSEECSSCCLNGHYPFLRILCGFVAHSEQREGDSCDRGPHDTPCLGGSSGKDTRR